MHPVNQTKISRVRLQSWYKPSARARYWIVSPVIDQKFGKFDLLPKHTPVDVRSATLLENLEEQERHRLEQLEQDSITHDAEIEEDETTPWLRYTR
jgi:hypothetical protein